MAKIKFPARLWFSVGVCVALGAGIGSALGNVAAGAGLGALAGIFLSAAPKR